MNFDKLEFEAAYDIQRFTNIKDSNCIISNGLINSQPIIRVEGITNYTEFYNSVISSILEYKNEKISASGLAGYSNFVNAPKRVIYVFTQHFSGKLLNIANNSCPSCTSGTFFLRASLDGSENFNVGIYDS